MAFVPCAGCGKRLPGGRSSLPAGQRTCHLCRRQATALRAASRRGQCFECRKLVVLVRQPGRGDWLRSCYPRCESPCDDCGKPTGKHRSRYGRLCEACSDQRARARTRKKHHLRRITADLGVQVTAAYEQQLRRNTKRCPLAGCGAQLTDTPYQPNSRHLDHIVPLNIGGTHTIGNVRVICMTCNLSRPKDGSDVSGQLVLWAQDTDALTLLAPLPAPPKPEPLSRSQPRQPRLFDVGRRAAIMRADGKRWTEIVQALGFSGTGAAHNAASSYGDPEVIQRWQRALTGGS